MANEVDAGKIAKRAKAFAIVAALLSCAAVGLTIKFERDSYERFRYLRASVNSSQASLEARVRDLESKVTRLELMVQGTTEEIEKDKAP